MEYMHKIKKMLCKELEEYGEKKSLSSSDVEMIHKLTDTVKNLDKIEMLEGDDGYSETYPYYMGGSSYARGRGRNARRDSMGRYSSDMGSSYDDYSEARMDRRYSRDDAKDHMMNKLGEMMSSADEEQREILKDAMRKIERA
jgi:DNA-directed RNA polymerase sigma subunit (sigma70/sigma32)